MPSTEDPGVAAEPSRVPAAILVVGANNQELARVVEQLRRRCGADYAIIAERSATRGIERLKSLRDEGSDLAIILADWQLPDGSGIELLSQARSFSPDAKRALLLSWSEAHRADLAWASDYARAASLGELHGIVPKPDVEPDERFQLAIQELLDN
jgi:thioredoxin reductase (NADPH)